MSADIVASILNTRVVVRIAPSPIHGVGIFAIRDLYKGQRLYMDALPEVYRITPGNLSKLFPEVKALLTERFPRLYVDSVCAYPDARYQAYCNHSEDYNYDCLTDTLIEDVKAGEEITENYRNIQGWQEAHPWLIEEKEV
jgi:hypothetical protein